VAESGGIDVALADFSIDPAAIEVEQPGQVTLAVRNDGELPHALTVEGASTGTLAPGESGELTVSLEDGAYALYCPVGNHRSQGMEAALTVGDAPAGGATTVEDEDDSGRGYGYG
jgi:uncharacterized cupredoxin-like copper-binding protein